MQDISRVAPVTPALENASSRLGGTLVENERRRNRNVAADT